MSTRQAAAGDAAAIVGARIRIRRRLFGMSQTDLAKVLGVSDHEVNAFERGEASVPAPLLARFAEVLGTSLDGLLGEDPDEVIQPALEAEGGRFW